MLEEGWMQMRFPIHYGMGSLGFDVLQSKKKNSLSWQLSRHAMQSI
jgi:hypothetical protein